MKPTFCVLALWRDGEEPPLHQLRIWSDIGYGRLYFPDHPGVYWDPIAAIILAAEHTTLQTFGTLVLNVARRPLNDTIAVLSQLMALAENRRVFIRIGLGSGWSPSDWADSAEMPPTEERLRILIHAIKSFHSKQGASSNGDSPRVKLGVGGGGRGVLFDSISAGAEFTNLSARLPHGRFDATSLSSLEGSRTLELIGQIKERGVSDISINVIYAGLGPDRHRQCVELYGSTSEFITSSPHFLTGPGSVVVDKIKRFSDAGVTEWVLPDPNATEMAPVVEKVVGGT